MSQPFFSILLPTKNRSEIVGDAIASVLEQSFADFEIIVSDNDDSPTATATAVAKFQDPRIRYYRTSGKLPMHDNWDNALAYAIGKHVIVLEDKMRLVGRALEYVRHYLNLHGDIPISFSIAFSKEAMIEGPKTLPNAHFIQSRSLIDSFCRFEQGFFEAVPRGLNSSAPKLLTDRIKQYSPTGYVFSPMSPDYAFGFMLLANCDRILHIPVPLMYVPNNWMWRGMYSNGQSSYKKDSQIKRFIAEMPVKVQDIIDLVPVKTSWLWINGVFYDFKTKYQRPDHRPNVDWVRYHSFCLLVVILGKKMKADMSEELREIRLSLRKEGLYFSLKVLAHLAFRICQNAYLLARRRLSTTG